MAENERQQEMIERLQEDERMRGDLGDEAAAALLAWAEAQVRTLTDDPARPDAEVEPAVLQVRSAARRAAKSGAADPQAIAAQAEAELATLRAEAQPPAPTPEQQPIEAVLAPPAPDQQPTEAAPPAPEQQPIDAALAPPAPDQQPIDAAPPAPEQQPIEAAPAPTLVPAPPQPTPPAAPADSDALQQWRERLRRWLGR